MAWRNPRPSRRKPELAAPDRSESPAGGPPVCRRVALREATFAHRNLARRAPNSAGDSCGSPKESPFAWYTVRSGWTAELKKLRYL